MGTPHLGGRGAAVPFPHWDRGCNWDADVPLGEGGIKQPPARGD